jgi:hypothetical protein
MASMVLFAILTQTVYQKEPEPIKWIESCYGYNCDGYIAEPSIPSPYNYSSDYCKVRVALLSQHGNHTTITHYILTRCNL